MNIENHVVNLELSKRLKKLGVKQESEFWWVKTQYDGWKIQNQKGSAFLGNIMPSISAFLSSELGDLFPKDYCIEFNGDQWMCYKEIPRIEYGNTEADARAKMLIYLIENKIMGV